MEIRGCTFTGSYEKNAIKLNQRNGEDDVATDVKPSGDGEVKPATIASAVVADCTFSEGAKIQLGSQGKGEKRRKSGFDLVHALHRRVPGDHLQCEGRKWQRGCG